VIAGLPYTYYEYRAPGVESLLKVLVRTLNPSLVHLDSLDLFGYLQALEGCRIACTYHSIESDLLRLRADRIRPRLLAPYLRYQASMLERLERTLPERLDLNVMMSPVDAARLKVLAPRARTVVVPNGVDTEYFRPPGVEAEVPGRVTFLGPTYMFPNRDAVDFFLADVWPTVRRRSPDSTFITIGKVSAADRARYEAIKGVNCLGYVPDIRPHMAQGACTVVPIRVGGGTRLKILDAWAMGRAVVSTSIGCEGLEAVDGKNILIRDDPASFAEAVSLVLSDRQVRLRLGSAGRETVMRTYAWEVIGDGLLDAYRPLAEDDPGPVALKAD